MAFLILEARYRHDAMRLFCRQYWAVRELTRSLSPRMPRMQGMAHKRLSITPMTRIGFKQLLFGTGFISRRTCMQTRLFSRKAKDKSEEELSVENRYNRKTPLEHVLLRPGMYVGPNDKLPFEPRWVLENPPPAPCESLRTSTIADFHPEKQWKSSMRKRECEVVPALVKVFDEVLVNASDNRLRYPETCKRIDVVIDPGTENREPLIRVFNDGKGIPVQMHKEENMYVPELLFGHLLTGSNFDDSTKRVTGGRHGYGAKLSNIFSKSFTVEVADSSAQKLYRQTWTENMSKIGKAEISSYKTGNDYTCISFVPDLPRLTAVKDAYAIDADDYAIMCRRVLDIAGCSAGRIRTSLNGFDVSVPDFESYVNLYRSSEAATPMVLQAINERWSVGVSLSDTGFESVSFVNGMSTDRGGTHVEVITKQITECIKSKIAKLDKSLLPLVSHTLVKRHLFVAMDALIDNPTFDSQMKEHLTTSPVKFGSSYDLPKKFVAELTAPADTGGPGIIEEIIRAAIGKQKDGLVKLGGKTSKKKFLDIPKLEDAHQAGSSLGSECTLILTEGDSAKALAVAGLEVVGRKLFGVFPLRGKFLNVRHAPPDQLSKNAEVKALCSVLGLNFKKKYNTVEERLSLRYGRVMLMTDMDNDGSHIKGLVINFFRFFWPDLLSPAVDEDPEDAKPFLSTFITPLLKARRGKEVVSFYSSADFNSWKNSVGADISRWTIKYYKGLGTSTSSEAKEYFSAFDEHFRVFNWESGSDGDLLDMAFDKDRAKDRRDWIDKEYDEQSSLYSILGKNSVSYEDFVNKELVQYSKSDNIRSIPSAIDGLKPSQRKVLYACFKRKLTSEVKVAQLSGYCAEHTAYHHGEASLQSTIIKMAQDFVGSNNINLLVPSGQFGTRHNGGEDAASPRYIFTSLSPITRALFPEDDDCLLTYLEDDGEKIEPQFYCPVIPLLLVNGCRGIGTGWSTLLPPHNPHDVVRHIRAKLDEKDELPEINPFVRGFTGTFISMESGAYLSTGNASKTGSRTVVIDELPYGCWTDSYKETLLKMREEGIIAGFIEHHTTTKVAFEIRMPNGEKMELVEKRGLEKAFKLTSKLNMSNIHAFDYLGMIAKFNTPEDIIDAFFPVRFNLYEDRLSVLQSESEFHALVLRNKSRFIQLVVNGEINLTGGVMSKSMILARLDDLGFDCSSKLDVVRNNNAVGRRQGADKAQQSNDVEGNSRYDYLLSMALSSLTRERIQTLEEEAKKKDKELAEIRGTTAKELWHSDLDKLSPLLPQ